MKPLSEARREVLAAVRRLPSESVPLEQALGLVLARDVVAPEDVPPFANSAMDGYAVRHADIEHVPASLVVSEDVAAGHVAAGRVEPGTAVKIMTGAPIPPGADTVVKVEDTTPGEGSVVIEAATARGTAIREAGGDVSAGTIVLSAGTRLAAPHLGVLATAGVARPEVARRPVVGIMSTGDEVRDPAIERLEPGWIRDANRPVLHGLLGELGVEVRDYGIVRDDADTLRSTIETAAAECDAILTSGGVSMGEYDLVKQVLTELGDIDLWRVAMQPAKPFAFGSIDGTPLFGLPGNPVSVVVAFEQFARPALLTMMGARRRFRPRITGRLAEGVETDPAKTVFLRVRMEDGDPGRVRLAGGQQSNVLSALAAADAFGVVPVGTASRAAGDPITLELFRAAELREDDEAAE